MEHEIEIKVISIFYFVIPILLYPLYPLYSYTLIIIVCRYIIPIYLYNLVLFYNHL